MSSNSKKTTKPKSKNTASAKAMSPTGGDIKPLAGCMPIVVTPVPGSASPGQTVTVVVLMDQVCVAKETVAIAGGPIGAWSSIPTSVTVPKEQQSASFYATISPTYTGSYATITATANGGSASGAVALAAVTSETSAQMKLMSSKGAPKSKAKSKSVKVSQITGGKRPGAKSRSGASGAARVPSAAKSKLKRKTPAR